jgi:polyhydroxybutyrate depolymerase
VRRVDRDVTKTTERRCRDHTAVQLYTVRGGGHTWPGAKNVARPRLGTVTGSIDASDLMLAFFAAHPARG